MSQSRRLPSGKSAKFQIREQVRDTAKRLAGNGEHMDVSTPNLHRLKAGIALSLVVMAGASSAQTCDPACDPAVELAVRQAIPKPAHCGATQEPFFYCRSDTDPDASTVLELSASKDSSSASLTYNYGDRKSTELLAVVRDFFRSVGVDANSFDRCIRQSHTASGPVAAGDWTLRCLHADFDNRITYEISADRTPKARPKTAEMAVRLRSGD